MSKKELRVWKKVFENDLSYVVSEFKETVLRPACIILTGEVGAGKTSFVKAFASDGPVASPTYSILTETPTMLHADFYRLEDPEEIISLEMGLYLEGKDYFLVEWGMKFFRPLMQELDESLNLYELVIEVSPNSTQPSREYRLFSVDRY